jgi:hypothetical protein
MKKLLAILVLAVSAVPAYAQHGHHFSPHSGYHRGFNSWFVPALIGAGAVYIATRPEPVVVQQPQVVLQQPPVVLQQPGYGQRCTPWTEIQNPDGTITRQRQCY